MITFDIQEIYNILPQRFPFIMIDKIIELEPQKRIVAIKNVSINENFFVGHFPGNPIMPGVLIIEAMAQAAIILFCYNKDSDIKNTKTNYYLGAVKVRFLEPVIPGDILEIIITPVKIISNAAIVKATAKVQDKEVASGELSFALK